MLVFTDQTGRTIYLTNLPERIVSIVPSQTELLANLGLEQQVVGITKFCIHPEKWFRSKIRVGGTKQLNHHIIRSLDPDLILANKEENQKEDVELLARDYPVWISDISTLDDALNMIEAVGNITGTAKKAGEINEGIQQQFAKIEKPLTFPSTCYLIWKDPYMTAGADTFIHTMLQMAGFTNCFGNLKRYPVVTIHEIKEKKPSLLFLSSEPYPFSAKHIDALQLELPDTKIMLVDGEVFSWYGSRLLYAPAYFQALNQQIF